MPAYLVVNLDVKDVALFATYTSEMPGLLKRFGGEFVVRGGQLKTLEGEAPKPRLVIIQFPSAEQAQLFYDSPEYEPLKKIRHLVAQSNVVLVEGYQAN